MKRLVYMTLFFFLLCGNVYAGSASRETVVKARDFMTANMYPSAIALLEKEVFGIGGDLSKGNPRNHEAQFLLGLCYVREGRLDAADERFASAIQLKPDYGYEISKSLKDVGIDAVKQGQLKTALMIFNRAEYYEPAIMGAIVRELVALGNNFLDKGRSDRADIAFAAAVSLNPSSESEVCGRQYAAGLEADDEAVIFAFPLKPYCPTFNRMVGEKLISIARVKAMAGKDAEKEQYKKAAAKYLGEELADVLLPEVIVHGPGEYIFELKAGERTPHWIAFPDGSLSQANFYYKKGSEYLRITEDGRVVGQNESMDGKFLKFKIQAVKNSYIKMVVQ